MARLFINFHIVLSENDKIKKGMPTNSSLTILEIKKLLWNKHPQPKYGENYDYKDLEFTYLKNVLEDGISLKESGYKEGGVIEVTAKRMISNNKVPERMVPTHTRTKRIVSCIENPGSIEGQVPGSMVPQGQVPGSMVLQSQVPGSMVPQGQVLGSMVHQGQVPGSMVHQGQVPGSMIHQRQVPGSMVPQGQVPGSMVPQGQVTGSIVHQRQVRTGTDKMNVTFEVLKSGRDSTSLNISTDDSKKVLNVKRLLWKKLPVKEGGETFKSKNFIFRFNGTTMEDGKSLREYGFQDGRTIEVTVGSIDSEDMDPPVVKNEMIQVFIKLVKSETNTKTYNVHMKESDTVVEAKKLLWNKLPPEDRGEEFGESNFELTYDGDVMKDGKTLKEYGFQDGITILAISKVTGGR